MTLSVPGRTIVFDYGEVISRGPSPDTRAALEEAAGVNDDTRDVFWSIYGRNRGPLDSGAMSVVAYWSAIAEALGATWPVSRIHQIWAIDFPAWLTPEPGTIDIIAELHESGTPLAILSNAGLDFASPLRFSPIGSLFDRVFVSAEMDDLKPSATIYQTVLDELAITPAEMVFVDNKEENVRGAEALGITGHVFTSPDSLRAFLLALPGASSE